MSRLRKHTFRFSFDWYDVRRELERQGISVKPETIFKVGLDALFPSSNWRQAIEKKDENQTNLF